MHLLHPGMHLMQLAAITHNFDFVQRFFANMMLYVDYKIVSVCPSLCLYFEKRNHPSFVNINPTVVKDT